MTRQRRLRRRVVPVAELAGRCASDLGAVGNWLARWHDGETYPLAVLPGDRLGLRLAVHCQHCGRRHSAYITQDARGVDWYTVCNRWGLVLYHLPDEGYRCQSCQTNKVDSHP